MDFQKHKKDSVFSGMFPSNEPAPPPPPAHAAPRPAVSEEQVAALNRKIELMEKNIVGQIEKKLSEHPPAAEQNPAGAAALSKIEEMEARMKDFQEKFLLGAAQIKNIEESKISARREIEELLKVVREQQKYSELDRAMHAQLEKAWTRVEELEKRMMEVYTTAAKKPAEPAAPAVSPAEIAAAVLKAVDARLEERLAPLETALKNAALKIETGPAAVRGIEGRGGELSAAVDARLAGFSAEIRQLHIEAFAGKERVEEIITEVKRDVLSSVREVLAESGCVFIKHVDMAALDGRERMDALLKLTVDHVDGLSAVCGNNGLKMDALGSLVKSENMRMLAAVSAMRDEIEKALRAGIEAAAGAARAENAGQLEKIKKIYGLSASNLAALSAVFGNISALEESLSGVSAGVKGFVKGLSSVNMEALLGVSGALIKKSFESAGALAVELEKERLYLAKTKGEIAATMAAMNIKPGA